MMSEEYTVVISGQLMGLNVIDYSISLSGEDFDKSVSSFSNFVCVIFLSFSLSFSARCP